MYNNMIQSKNLNQINNTTLSFIHFSYHRIYLIILLKTKQRNISPGV